eukprot:SAG11_NODE_36442_length_261_cov_1.209877_1_plen_86_part_11
MRVLTDQVCGAQSIGNSTSSGTSATSRCSTPSVHPTNQLGNYTDLYLRVAYDCLHMFRVRELAKVGEAAAEAARRVANGGEIVSAI